MSRAAVNIIGVMILLLTFVGVARAEEPHGFDAAARLDIEVAWLEGNIERMAEFEGKVASAQDLLCFAIRDLYWRPEPVAGATRKTQFEGLSQPAPGSLLARRWAWLLQETRDSPWPVPAGIEIDRWPALSLLIQDRQRREQLGYVGYPGQDPISMHVTKHAGRGDLDADLRLVWLSHAGDELGRVYGDLPETDDELDARARAMGARLRNKLIGIAGLLALVLLTLAYARRVKPDA